MSNLVVPLKSLLVNQSVVNLVDSDKLVVPVVNGGSVVTYNKFPSTSYSQSNINWNINLPSRRTIVSKRIILAYIPYF